MLSAAGEIRNVFIGTDRETGRSRGFAFVEFATETGAADAIQRFDGHEVDGRKVRVNAADDRPRRPMGAPGGAPPRSGYPSYQPAGPSMFRDNSEPSNFFGGGGENRSLRNKGSRRGLRARKRSLNY